MTGAPQTSSMRGFTLIETLAALTVFAIMTIGIVPLIGSSMRAATTARASTVGKNAAAQAMERIRGLPYFISYGAQAKKVDVLDLYYPAYDDGHSATTAGQVYRTICTASSTNPACPKDLSPDVRNLTITFDARFVTAEDVPQTEPAPTDYAYNSTSGKDAPPSQFLEMSVAASWTIGSQTRTFNLQSLIGDRKFGTVRVSGNGRIEYGVKLLTALVGDDTEISDLTTIVGGSESSITTRLISTGDQSVDAADIRLVRRPSLTATLKDLDVALGVAATYHAPPDTAPLDVSAGEDQVFHPAIDTDPVTDGVQPLQVGFINDTSTDDVDVKASGGLPLADGGYAFGDGTGQNDAWIDNQADTSIDALLHLHPTDPVAFVRPGTSGNTSSYATAIDSNRRVKSSATVTMDDLRLMPVTFILDQLAGEHSVLIIDSFTASVTCDSTASTTTAVATGTWEAKIRYWKDDGNDLLQTGSYQSFTLTGTIDGVTNVGILDGLKGLNNPLVYDDPIDALDVYLFQDTLHPNGYLKSMTVKAPSRAIELDGRSTSAFVDGAVSIRTTPLDPTLAESAVDVSLGKLSCEALDRR